MEILFSLRLPAEAATVPVVRTLCRGTMLQLGVDPRCIEDVALAVTEACANVVEHGGPATHPYEVQVELRADWCHIRIIDHGRGFDAAGLPTGPVPSDAERGRGIALMRAVLDRIDFESRPEAGTIAHLQKRLVLRQDSPLLALRLSSEAS